MKRLTTDKPSNNTEAMLNYAYAKDGYVHLRYANGKEGIRLTEYLSCLAQEIGCESATEENILHGDVCSGCDCEVAILNVLAIQAAELRERLKKNEDAEEQGLLVRLPCKLGDTVYWIMECSCRNIDGVYSKCEFYGYEPDYGADCEICNRPEGTKCPHQYRISEGRAKEQNILMIARNLGKTVFLTREEAEKALEKA